MRELASMPVYGMGQVDYLLGIPSGTARRWIDGYRRSGRDFPPVIRFRPTGSEIVTWGEFVEARLLVEYRARGVPMHKLRPVIDRLRVELRTPYPLAAEQPLVLGRDLVRRIQDEESVDEPLRLVVIENDQLVLADPADRFYRSILWGPSGEPLALLPDAAAHRVTLNPLIAFGSPVVRAVRTATIVSEFRAGEPPERIAEAYELDPADVSDAIRYELARAA